MDKKNHYYDKPKLIPMSMLKKGEKIVFESHPHKGYTLFSPWAMALGLFIIGISVYIAGSMDKAIHITGISIILIGILWGVVAYFKWRFTIYGLTTERIIRLTGVIAKDIYENPIVKIQDIRLKISFLQRLWKCGNIMIYTAGTSTVECIWKNIGNPQNILKLVRAMIKHPTNENIATSNIGNLEQIEKLAEMKAKGVITEEEFEKKKKELL